MVLDSYWELENISGYTACGILNVDLTDKLYEVSGAEGIAYRSWNGGALARDVNADVSTGLGAPDSNNWVWRFWVDMDNGKFSVANIEGATGTVIDEVNSFYETKIAEVYAKYEQKLILSNSLDFDDLLLKTVELFNTDEDSLAFWSKKFQYIMVDEYQDTNYVQYKIIELLSRGHKNICVVGDSDQSIYAFRGADIRNIDEFDKAYEEGTMFLLTTHPHIIGHRSRIIILEKLIEHILTKGDVWFANHQQIAEYVLGQAGMD